MRVEGREKGRKVKKERKCYKKRWERERGRWRKSLREREMDGGRERGREMQGGRWKEIESERLEKEWVKERWERNGDTEKKRKRKWKQREHETKIKCKSDMNKRKWH